MAVTRWRPRKRRNACAGDAAQGAGTPEVIEVSGSEYQQAVRDALSEEGLTYTQLRAQARKGDFVSLRARKLWLAIGEPKGAR